MSPLSKKIFMSVLVTIISATAQHALAFSMNGDDVSGMFGSSEPAGPCLKDTPIEKRHTNLNFAGIMAYVQKYSEQKYYCKAMAYARKGMGLAETASELSGSWQQLIEAAFNQRDYGVQLTESRGFLRQYPVNAGAERVHYLAVKAVFENIELSEGKDPAWIQEALGVGNAPPVSGDEDSADALPRVTFSLQGFREKYPQSYYIHDIEAMLFAIKDRIADRVIADAAHNHATRNYVPAIVQLQLLVQQGPSLKQFSKALYVMIRVIETFSYDILNEKNISNEKLARWLGLGVEEVNMSKRHETSSQLQAQAKKLSRMMAEKLPEDPWTKKMLSGL